MSGRGVVNGPAHGGRIRANEAKWKGRMMATRP